LAEAPHVLRVPQATSFAKDVSDAAEDLLRATEAIQVCKIHGGKKTNTLADRFSFSSRSIKI
jgi:hypothetical protein